AFRAAFGIEADKLSFNALGIDELAFVRLEIFAVRAGAQSGTVVLGVIENRFHVLSEIGVIGNLNHDVVIDLGGVKGVPNDDGKNLIRAAQVELNVLRAFAQKNDALIGGFLVAIGDFIQHFLGGILVAGGRLGAFGQILQTGRNHHGRPRFVGIRLRIGVRL